MTKILFRDVHILNKGDAARAACAFKILRKFLNNADLSSISNIPEFETSFYKQHNVRLIVQERSMIKSVSYIFRSFLWAVLCQIGFNLNVLIDQDILKEYRNADVIISLTGDALSDDNGVYSSISFCLSTLPCIFLGKPFVFLSTSIGSFKTGFTKFLAKYTLNKMELIIAREEITRTYLEAIGIRDDAISLAPDPAFILKPASFERVHEILSKEDIDLNIRPTVGMSVTMVYSSFQDSPSKSHIEYFILMAKLADYLIEEIAEQVIFIPETVVSVINSHDDLFVAREIKRLSKHKDNIKLIQNEYDESELKGIIGQCDLFIGTRLHACIFSASMEVPTIAIAYHHKTLGIMKMIGLEEYVLDIKELDLGALISKISEAWRNRIEIRERLASSEMDTLRDSAWLNGKLINDLMESKPY